MKIVQNICAWEESNNKRVKELSWEEIVLMLKSINCKRKEESFSK